MWRGFGTAWIVLAATAAAGAALEVWPGEDLKAVVNGLSAGDTLVLHGGTYDVPDGIKFNDKAGTEASPIVVRAAEGETPVLKNSSGTPVNLIEINNCSYLTLSGLELTGGPWGSDAIRSSLGTHNSHITIEYCHIHNVGATGINVKGNDDNNWLIRCNEIHDTDGSGEAMYLGSQDSFIYILRDSTIEFNFIHDTGGSQGDGIELKGGGYGNIIRSNVICRINYPGIILYDGQPGSPNIVEGNVIWDVAVDSGIQVGSNAVIRNNIVFGCAAHGVSVKSTAVAAPHAVSVVNNTFYDNGMNAVKLNNGSEIVVANNACYALTPSHVVMRAVNSSVVSAGNVYYGALEGFSAGCTEGGTPAADMMDPANRDFWPTASGSLVDAASASYAPENDFDDTPRPYGPADDVGAYEWTQAENPGWAIVEGFKESGVTPGPDGDGDGRSGCAVSVRPDGAALVAWVLLLACWPRARRSRSRG